MSTLLQALLLPGLDLGAPEDMYVRSGDGVRLFLRERRIVFKDGARVSFDTFFNGLTVATWRQVCQVPDLHFELRGTGKFILRFGLHRLGHGQRWLDEQVIQLQPDEKYTQTLAFWPQLDGGMLYATLEALGDAVLLGGGYVTQAPPLRDVKLGIVITHFNRKDFVLPAARRLREQLLGKPQYHGKIELVIVDNASTIAAEEVPGATVLANRNLGGSGGFMRGLLYLKDQEFSHCLFMDDDASCEIDAVARSFMMLRYAKIERLAIAGGLLRALEPYRLFEKGAQFDGTCHPLKSGLDMRDIHSLLLAEQTDRLPDYGGWWFFAFAIADLRHYAFPFFVRGDDIQFSLLNDFDIHTMNGIACWGDDFGLKSGPLPIYLDVRNHILQNICVRHASLWSTVRIVTRIFMFAGLSYNYGTARAVTLALADVSEGTGFWTRDMEMSQKRRQIAAFSAAEKMLPVRRAAFDVHYRSNEEGRARRWLRILTLNGFLLPGFLLRDAVAFQHKGFTGSLRSVFRFRKVLYEHEPTGIGYLAQHDKRRFFAELFAFVRQLGKFVLHYRGLRRDYVTGLDALTSETFWRGIYADKLTEGVPAPASAGLPVSREALAVASRR